MNFWAAGFPNTIFGSCVQRLLASEFGVQGQWTNIDCTVKQPHICFRNGGVYGPTAFSPPPKADAHCPQNQYYTGSGTASVKFTVFNCQSGTTLAFYDGLNSDQPFLQFNSTSPSLNQSYTVTTNVMKIVFKWTFNSNRNRMGS
ncbi:hypothetical protein PENTCL1PPCAC_29948 [Pristionchus entomophagus]|uniref:CUB domain-containing protein n=1 Tax=Pristionchus entomophagus TaxID=358040 RepID=A0AAV5UL67_9BILA|nr:hypothetical protein PENTCL1PPCAC_29948 [Pristionchus entomophagus]